MCEVSIDFKDYSDFIKYIISYYVLFHIFMEYINLDIFSRYLSIMVSYL